LSTEAQARPISGSSPQKEQSWRELMRSRTTLGSGVCWMSEKSGGHWERDSARAGGRRQSGRQ